MAGAAALDRARATVLEWVGADADTRRATRQVLGDALRTYAEHNPADAARIVRLCEEVHRRPVWRKAARASQLTPGTPGAEHDRTDWDDWVISAGRGAGKTRTGSEETAERLKKPRTRWALVAATFAAGRDDMVEGESGLIRCLPPSLLVEGSVSKSWNRSMGELKLANGSRSRIYTSEKPDLLRGPQHHGAWGDEIVKWRDGHKLPTEESTWSMLKMGLRLGRHPQTIITTTPKPLPLLIGTRQKPHLGLLNAPTSVVTTGTTYDNLANLAPTFRNQILAWEGTRLGRQELLAEILTDIEGALWHSALIELWRVAPGYEQSTGGLRRIVVAVDPSVGAGTEGHDECGIIVAGVGFDGQLYVLADYSLRASPETWARAVVKAYRDFEADRVIAETNQGGALVRAMLNVTKGGRDLPYRAITAKRGKALRAEPVAGLYEAARVHHVGLFPDLEDQMTQWVPTETKDSPDRVDALVYALTDLSGIGGTAPSTGSRRGPTDRR